MRAGGEGGKDEWGAIGAWAWGLSRALDYFETDSDIDHERIAVMGHSRLGKTALWADPRGEFLAAKEAGGVYALFGKDGLAGEAMPGAGQPLHRTIRYHLREGKHSVTPYDWEQWLRFAEQRM